MNSVSNAEKEMFLRLRGWVKGWLTEDKQGYWYFYLGEVEKGNVTYTDWLSKSKPDEEKDMVWTLDEAYDYEVRNMT